MTHVTTRDLARPSSDGRVSYSARDARCLRMRLGSAWELERRRLELERELERLERIDEREDDD